MRFLKFLSLAAALGVPSGAASAATVDFTFNPSGSSVESFSERVSGSILDTPASFSLGSGDTHTFAAIRFSFGADGAPDGAINANLAFATPDVEVVARGSVVLGFSFDIEGFTIIAQAVGWGAPVTFLVGTSTFGLEMSDVSATCQTDACISYATVSGINVVPAEVNVIPLPAAGWLLLSGLAGLSLMARRKQKMAA